MGQREPPGCGLHGKSGLCCSCDKCCVLYKSTSIPVTQISCVMWEGCGIAAAFYSETSSPRCHKCIQTFRRRDERHFLHNICRNSYEKNSCQIEICSYEVFLAQTTLFHKIFLLSPNRLGHCTFQDIFYSISFLTLTFILTLSSDLWFFYGFMKAVCIFPNYSLMNPA